MEVFLMEAMLNALTRHPYNIYPWINSAGTARHFLLLSSSLLTLLVPRFCSNCIDRNGTLTVFLPFSLLRVLPRLLWILVRCLKTIDPPNHDTCVLLRSVLRVKVVTGTGADIVLR